LYQQLGIQPFVTNTVTIKDFELAQGTTGGKTSTGHRH